MPHNIKSVEVTSVVCSSIAIGLTLIRLVLRRKRLWADDAWALFSMLSLVIQVVGVFLPPDRPGVGVFRYYLMAATFYTTIWSARLSLLFSIIRIDLNPLRRSYLFFNAYLFGMLCLLLVAQLFWDCEPRRRWKLLNPPQCHIGLQVAIFQLISDILVDLTLLIAPLCLFRSIRDEWLRYRLVGIFSTCIITTVVSLVHAAYILTKGGVRVLIAGLVEASSSLFGNMARTMRRARFHSIWRALHFLRVPCPSQTQTVTCTRSIRHRN
ncbi:hypothetical protein AX15_000790 [Amanita polypyramis BW_CC]|nr:hypothetical protein AX15_000790 [Amanita polypyramis BW_CC]